MKKRVIIADVDGTICESCQKISPEMADQINLMINEGYIFVFISGTSVEYLQKMISSSLTGKHYILGTTGTRCVEVSPEEKKEIYNYSLSEEEKSEIMLAFENLIAKYNVQTMTTKEDQLQDRGSQITLSAIGRNASLELKRLYDPDGTKRREWVVYLKTLLDQNKYEIRYAGTTSVDVTRKGLDKGWGIKKFANHYNINLQEILFFGDKTDPEGNDYPATLVVDYVTVNSPDDTLEELRKL